MSPTPRCFLIRHGETEWSRSGRHTSSSEIALTSDGERRIIATGQALVGDDRLIVPGRLARIYVSPRLRAQRTLELLNLACPEPYPWQNQQRSGTTGSEAPAQPQSEPKPDSNQTSNLRLRQTNAKLTVTEDVREWEYGDYEGITSAEIRQGRAQREEPVDWNIWTDGCPGGESPDQITQRLDGLIHEIKSLYHAPVMGRNNNSDGDGDGNRDVLIVAHGHILRALATRWISKPLDSTSLLLEAGGVGTLSYEHNNIEEPAILLGGSFVVG